MADGHPQQLPLIKLDNRTQLRLSHTTTGHQTFNILTQCAIRLYHCVDQGKKLLLPINMTS